MEDLIKQKCEAAGVSPDILTDEEIKILKREIQSEQNGKSILGSVLDNPAIHYRQIRR